MQISNTLKSYGLATISIHWLFALGFFVLLGTGLYMVELTYYDSLYKPLPNFHRSIGIILFGLLALRLFWRITNVKPLPEPNLKSYEIHGAEVVHWILYMLPFIIMISGYLITTADGSSISVFGLFEIPAILPAQKGREDIAGFVHQYLAYTCTAIVALHALAALKHHFLDRDKTLLRIFKTIND